MPNPSGDLFYLDLIRSYVDQPRFTPRPWLAKEVADRLDQLTCRYLLLTAEPGAGKTAFSAWQAQQHPDWLRYFIRRDSLTPLSSGDIRSFLFALGHQLAAQKPILFHPDNLTQIVQQRIGTIQPGGKVIGLQVEDLVVSPFYHTALQVEQNVEVVAGELIGLSARRAITEERFLDPLNLLYLALLDPLAALKTLEPATRLVILVDALDEIRYQAQGDTLLSAMASWPELPDNLRFVLTSRPDKGLLGVFRQSQANWLSELEIHTDADEVQNDLRIYVTGFAAEPPIVEAMKVHQVKAEGFIDGAVTRADGNFQYVAALARAIENAVDQAQTAVLGSLLKLEGILKGLEPLYAHFIRLIRNNVGASKVETIDLQSGETTMVEAWENLYQPAMGVLAVAQTPLNADRIMAFGGLLMEPRWLNGALFRLNQFLDQVEGGYRFYHATLREFLVDPDTQRDYPDCYLGAAEWHRKTADALLKACGKNWNACKDEYALQHAPVHLLGAAGEDATPALRPLQLRRLYALAHNDDYFTAYLNQYRLPGRLLNFLQDALRAALQSDDLAETWRLIERYQSFLRQERDFTRLEDEIQAGDLRLALARSGVYAGQPNAQALARMWLAWLAARAGDADLAREAARQSLNTLRGQTVNPELAQVDQGAAYETTNRLEISLARLLTRTALAPETTAGQGHPTVGSDPRLWYDQVRSDYKFLNDWLWSTEYDRGRESWAQSYDYVNIGPDPVARLEAMEHEVLALDPRLVSGENSMQWRDQLCHILTHTFDRQDWQDLVERAVKLISLDDYPSYREMSLAWLVTAAVAHPDEAEAQQAIQAILKGMLSAREPDLPEDARAMILGLQLVETGQTINAEILRNGLADHAESQQAREAMGGRGRHDPWAWDVRRANAIAGALARLKSPNDAKGLLSTDGQQQHWQSFAGYRCLAYLAVALRWFELGETTKAQEMGKEALETAERMNDEIVKRQRRDLINEVFGWLNSPIPAAIDNDEAAALVRDAAAMGGARRSYRLQYLSALWQDDEENLKSLLPYSLDDPIAADAILGRLLGSQMGQPPLQGEALEMLAKAMKLA